MGRKRDLKNIPKRNLLKKFDPSIDDIEDELDSMMSKRHDHHENSKKIKR
ncbi:MAG: hypothetical protein HRT74_10200 [Flavobacteriales bacterium]|nr:hypothetical protein [Flavobacteriales bacterium]